MKMESNKGGEDKVFPLGPKSRCMGKGIPCFTC
jgi:hypothetical protein